MSEFTTDLRESNPALHLVYVRQAVTHLQAIDRAKLSLSGFGNLNLLDVNEALSKERRKLVQNNAAYADADEILNSLEEP